MAALIRIAPGENQPAGHDPGPEEGDVQPHEEGGGAARQGEADHSVGYEGGRARRQHFRQAAAPGDGVGGISARAAFHAGKTDLGAAMGMSRLKLHFSFT